MDDLESKLPKEYNNSFAELMLIIGVAGMLFSAGLVNVGIHAAKNAFDSQKAEAIAKSMMRYKIPNGSHAQIGLNIGAIRMAIVTSKTNPPNAGLLIARIPVNSETNRNQLKQDFTLWYKSWIEQRINFTSSYEQTKTLCESEVSVTIQEGELALENRSSTIPITQYITSVTSPNSELAIVIFTNGQDAQTEAASIFDSLQCE
ncbi:MAG: hypothetical protein HC916_15820 [Coleofasciculaceae cyanobacterium SM2_1_6]|nr:hypothetical protein [Coleofasciculaceae cyanobacterium SM2_1_6]